MNKELLLLIFLVFIMAGSLGVLGVLVYAYPPAVLQFSILGIITYFTIRFILWQ
jgi:hypothetical protein